MNSKLTPGIWAVAPMDKLAARVIYSPPGSRIAHGEIANCGPRNEANLANATAIAALPDLLAALQAMIKAGEYHFASSGWPAAFHAGPLNAARAAITKATGEAA